MTHDLHLSSNFDLAVLAHLRGYPEELRRFSNLITRAADDPPPRAS
jgi:hypothetical protein